MLLVPKSSHCQHESRQALAALSMLILPVRHLLCFMPPAPCRFPAFKSSCLPAPLPPRLSPEHRNPAKEAVQALVLLVGGQRGMVLEGRHPLLQQVSLAAAGQGTNPVLLPC